MTEHNLKLVAHLVPFLALSAICFVVTGFCVKESLREIDLFAHAGSQTINQYVPVPVSQNTQGDYLDAVGEGGLFRWSADRLPLEVHIEDGSHVPGYKDSYRQMAVSAFDAWCSKSKGILSWRLVNDPRQADIVLSWTDNPTVRPDSVEAGQTRTLVEQNRETGEGRIVTAHISILTELMGRQFSDTNMYKTCLHEVGHSLGLQGHSNVSSDIMYPTVNDNQVAYLKGRDLNTLTRLYSETNDSIATAPSRFNSRRTSNWGTGNLPGGFGRIAIQRERQPEPQSQWMRPAEEEPYFMPRHGRGRWGRNAAWREYMRQESQQQGWN